MNKVILLLIICYLKAQQLNQQASGTNQSPQTSQSKKFNDIQQCIQEIQLQRVRVNQLITQINLLKNTNEGLQEQALRNQISIQLYQKQVREFGLQIDTYVEKDEMLRQLKAQMALLTAENDELSKNLLNCQKAQYDQKYIDSLLAQITQLTNDKNTLQIETEELKKNSQVCLNNLANSQNQIQTLNKDIEQVSIQKTNLEQENDQQKSFIIVKENELQQCQQDIEDQKQKLTAECNSEKEKLNQQINICQENAKEEAIRLNQEIQQKNSQIEQLQQEVQQIDVQNQQLITSNQQLKSDLSNAVESINNLNNELSNVKNENSNLKETVQNQIQEIANKDQIIEDLKQANNNLKTENDKVKQDNQQLKEQRDYYLEMIRKIQLRLNLFQINLIDTISNGQTSQEIDTILEKANANNQQENAETSA